MWGFTPVEERTDQVPASLKQAGEQATARQAASGPHACEPDPHTAPGAQQAEAGPPGPPGSAGRVPLPQPHTGALAAISLPRLSHLRPFAGTFIRKATFLSTCAIFARTATSWCCHTACSTVSPSHCPHGHHCWRQTSKAIPSGMCTF